MTETEIIKFLSSSSSSQKFIGDDAVFLPFKNEAQGLIIASDALIEGTHFNWDYCSLADVAVKLIEVNASDILIKGAKPQYTLFNFGDGLYLRNNKVRMKSFLRSFSRYLKEKNIQLVGGDTFSSEKTMLSLTMFAFGNKKIARENSKVAVGDIVLLGGGEAKVGASRLAFDKLAKGEKLTKAMKQFHTRPQADWKAAKWLHETEALVSIDTSDSLYESLEILSQANDVALDIDVGKIKSTLFINSLAWHLKLKYILGGGEDLAPLVIIAQEYKSMLNKLSKKYGLEEIGCVAKTRTKACVNYLAGENFINVAKEDLELYQHFSVQAE